MHERIWAIIPAAGVGTRMQAEVPKQYLPLCGRPIISHAIERLCSHSRVHGLVVGISAGDKHWPALRLPAVKNFIGTYAGGATRARTVCNGLRMLLDRGAHNADWVIVHDAVRPCVRQEDIDSLINTVTHTGAGGLLALPVADTVKRADAAHRVVETVSREGLWRALTPQMYRLTELHDALQLALGSKTEVTDESVAIEQAGGKSVVVAGHADNIKITHPGDLVLAELFLKQQAEGK